MFEFAVAGLIVIGLFILAAVFLACVVGFVLSAGFAIGAFFEGDLGAAFIGMIGNVVCVAGALFLLAVFAGLDCDFNIWPYHDLYGEPKKCVEQ